MSERPRLVIITHSSDRFLDRPTLAGHLMARWQTMGLDVRAVTERDAFVPADAALLHVDQSVVPDECVAVARRYPRVINGLVTDIRKRRVSTQLVAGPGDTAGRVIVKSNRNHCGWPEFERRYRGSLASRVLSSVLGEAGAKSALIYFETLRPWRWTRLLPEYRLYDSAVRVPRAVWRNPELVVDRFVAERDGENYVCRHWLFFGDGEISRRTVAHDPMVKMAGPPPRLLEPVPDELRALRRKLGFDYGKFDYTIVDGRLHLLDTNRTPGASRDPQVHAETLDMLADGVRAFIPALADARSGRQGAAT